MSGPKIVTAPTMYVGYQTRKEDGEDIKLGFATYLPLDETKKQKDAYEKRKSTVDSWHADKTYDRDERKWVETGVETEILDNSVPLDGFKIARSVRRYGWGGGNVLWRIEDPRGFELEISSANMASILDTCTLVHGVIGGKCVWGWTGGKVVLLPEDSQPYKDAVANTKLTTNAISAKDVNIGDRVQLVNGTVGVWAGRLYYAEIQRFNEGATTSRNMYDSHRDHRSYLTAVPSDKTSGFLVLDSGDVYMMSSPKFGEVLESNGGQTKEYGCDLVCKALSAGGKIERPGYGHHTVAVAVKKGELQNMTFSTRPTTESTESNRMVWWLEDGVAYSVSTYHHNYRTVMDTNVLGMGRISPVYVDKAEDPMAFRMGSHYIDRGKRYAPKTVPYPFEDDGNYKTRKQQRCDYADKFDRVEVVVRLGDYILPLLNLH